MSSPRVRAAPDMSRAGAITLVGAAARAIWQVLRDGILAADQALRDQRF